MKIRAGFVSNSSSSSFVVLLPENFIETIDFDKINTTNYDGDEDGDEFDLEIFKKFVNKFYKDAGYWRDYYSEDENEGMYYDALSKLIRPYIVADIDGSSDDGDKIIVLNREKIKKLL